MLKRHWLLFSLGALVVLLPIAFVIFVATFDWNQVRPWVQTRVGDAIGRNVAIGDLAAAWHWRSRMDADARWSPGLYITAQKLRISNPDWARSPRFAELQAIEIELQLLPLLRREISVPVAHLVRPSLDFERRKDASSNWTFAPAATDSASAWTLDLGEIEFDAGDVTIVDAERSLDLRADITALDAPIPFGQRVEGDDPSTRREVIQRVGRAAAQRLHGAAEQRAARAVGHSDRTLPYRFEWKAKGTMHGVAVDGNGRFGGVFALKESRPFPVRADIDVGTTEIALTGTITDPTSPDAIDMRLWVTGPNLAELYPIAGLVLPDTAPYATVGRLTGRFHPHRSLLRYEDFTAHVGGSDLEGTLTYKSGDPRATLTGNVDSTLLQFKDLGTLIGTNSATVKSARGDTARQASAKVLPVEPFNVERWNAMDADVHFTGKRVFREAQLPIQDVDTHIVMKDAVLSLDPLRFGMAGGSVQASLRIDAKTRPPNGELELDARKLQLRRLFEKVDGLSTGLGEVSGRAKLAGRGNSIAGLLGSSDGTLKLLMTEGRVSEALMEKAGLNLANVVLAKIAGDPQIDINCAAADFTAKDGMLATNLFVFDTDNAVIDIDGHISLADEKVDLTLHPHTNGLRVFSLRSPLHVEGSFRHVDVSVDKKSLFLRGATAIGLGLVAAPLAALVPLIAPNGNAPKSCAPLIAQANQAAPAKARVDAKGAAKPARSGRR
jgi:uncharacterized protein involved in outer membrane biogenesis